MYATFYVGHAKHATTSIARIVQHSTISSYLGDVPVPECGYILRATIKDPVTRKAGQVRIYDDNLNLIKTIDKK